MLEALKVRARACRAPCRVPCCVRAVRVLCACRAPCTPGACPHTRRCYAAMQAPMQAPMRVPCGFPCGCTTHTHSMRCRPMHVHMHIALHARACAGAARRDRQVPIHGVQLPHAHRAQARPAARLHRPRRAQPQVRRLPAVDVPRGGHDRLHGGRPHRCRCHEASGLQPARRPRTTPRRAPRTAPRTAPHPRQADHRHPAPPRRPPRAGRPSTRRPWRWTRTAASVATRYARGSIPRTTRRRPSAPPRSPPSPHLLSCVQ